MKVINLFGSPGSGKSTTMLGLTNDLKLLGASVENTPEFFKELIMEGSHKAEFGGQLFILAEQNRRIARLTEQNDFAVTDCPLPLISFYTKDDYIPGFKQMAHSLFHQYDNINYFIKRDHPFEVAKRIHSETESDKMSKELLGFLDEQDIKVKTIVSCPEITSLILRDLVESGFLKEDSLNSYRKLIEAKIAALSPISAPLASDKGYGSKSQYKR